MLSVHTDEGAHSVTVLVCVWPYHAVSSLKIWVAWRKQLLMIYVLVQRKWCHFPDCTSENMLLFGWLGSSVIPQGAAEDTPFPQALILTAPIHCRGSIEIKNRTHYRVGLQYYDKKILLVIALDINRIHKNKEAFLCWGRDTHHKTS